jgi:hypothetical protein
MTFLLGSPPDEAALVTQEAAIRLLEQALADEMNPSETLPQTSWRSLETNKVGSKTI